MRRFLMLALCLLLTGCPSGTSIETWVTVTNVVHDPQKMGCMGTDWTTTVKTDDGFTDRWCGQFGKIGDRYRAVRTYGHWDYAQNGIKRALK